MDKKSENNEIEKCKFYCQKIRFSWMMQILIK